MALKINPCASAQALNPASGFSLSSPTKPLLKATRGARTEHQRVSSPNRRALLVLGEGGCSPIEFLAFPESKQQMRCKGCSFQVAQLSDLPPRVTFLPQSSLIRSQLLQKSDSMTERHDKKGTRDLEHRSPLRMLFANPLLCLT